MTEQESYRWFKNQEFSLLDVMLRYYMGEIKFEVKGDKN